MEVIHAHDVTPLREGESAPCSWEKLDSDQDPELVGYPGRCDAGADVTVMLVLSAEPESILHAATTVCLKHWALLQDEQEG